MFFSSRFPSGVGQAAEPLHHSIISTLLFLPSSSVVVVVVVLNVYLHNRDGQKQRGGGCVGEGKRGENTLQKQDEIMMTKKICAPTHELFRDIGVDN